jgi:hypothetical protein
VVFGPLYSYCLLPFPVVAISKPEGYVNTASETFPGAREGRYLAVEVSSYLCEQQDLPLPGTRKVYRER